MDQKKIKTETQEFALERRQNSFESKESQEQQNQAEIQADSGEVSEFMDGLDVPKISENVSEKVREDDKKQKASGGKKSDSDDEDDVAFSKFKPLFIPPQRIMISRIRKELHKEINLLIKQAKQEEKKGAFYLNEIYEKIRVLKGKLSSLATATYEVVKNLYVSLFDKKQQTKKWNEFV